MPEMKWAIKGAAGRLRAGSRLAATLRRWEARHVEGKRWRFEFEGYDADPYWFEHGDNFKMTLDMGRSVVSGPATIVSRDPLIVEMEIDV